MHTTRWAALAATALLAVAAAGCGKSAGGSTTQTSTTSLSPTTPAATGDTGPVTWATYREVGTLDPGQAFDYPENTVISSMCDSLLQQQPDGTYKPGLATKVQTPDARTLILTIDTNAKFWDGHNVTPQDVVFSLQRHSDPKAASFYALAFQYVTSITATGSDQVTIKLSRPDNWLQGELSQMAGVVLEKAYVQSKGKAFGTPSGGTMCTGAFKLQSWKPGSSLTAVKNTDYWDSALAPKAASMVFKGVPDDASLTSGLLTNEITGTYPQPLTTLDQLKASSAVTVHTGPSFASDAFVVSSLSGALGDVRVRRALSMAVDRQAYINTLYKGYAQLPRTLANPGTWGYEKDVFQRDWNRLPEPTLDVAKGKQLVQQAGATGKTIVIGTSSEINSLETAANAIAQAAQSIGLKAKLKSVSAANYINFFTDPKARKGVDGFLTVNYPDFADPAALYNTFAIPGGTQNYDGFSDSRITAALTGARTARDQRRRAELTVKAGDLIMQQLPWIPLALPDTIVVMDKKITGAPSSFQYMGGPWAATIGAAG
ncbi:MAG TPA: ABC transporter substrate-binding protein [Solirubrobacteraceae bacterium]|nr:ABC transporter substrate-binding protein [Solirubrobacteraceae bacterium]